MSPALAGRFLTTVPPGKPEDGMFLSVQFPWQFSLLWSPSLDVCLGAPKVNLIRISLKCSPNFVKLLSPFWGLAKQEPRGLIVYLDFLI